jgi:hypothetical protein
LATTKGVNLASAALLGILFLVSLNSLASFPDSFADEGYYGDAGRSLVTTGMYTPDDMPDQPAYRLGDGIHPRIQAALFGYLGHAFGYSLAAARTISFVTVWCAVLLWLPISRSFGLPPFLAALAFASSERVFWASHVFRSEATLVLVNTVLVLAIARAASAEARTSYWVGRGLLNGALVLAHGNGVVSAIVNSTDALASCVRRAWRVRLARIAAYGAGALVALAAFYAVQVGPIGGWRAFSGQLASARQYVPHHGALGAIRADLEGRWGKELVVVGASPAAKLMRALWYATVLGAALWSIAGAAGLARKLGVMAFGTIVGYILLVHDKVDIHIAEMIPFFCAAFLSWLGMAEETGAGRRRVARIAAAVLIATGLGLCLHHGLKYRPQVYRPVPESTSAAVLGFLESREARSQPPVRAVVGNQSLWFWLRGAVPIVSTFRGRTGPALEGDVIVACDPAMLPWLDRCSLAYSDPAHRFGLYRCPSAAPAPR